MSQSRVIVAQPASLCRDGAGLLSVGVLRWTLPRRRVVVDDTPLTMAAQPAMTFIVKATYSYAACARPEDAMELAAEPEGLALDVPSELSGAAEDEIAYSSDFVPLVRMCGVTVTGHAFSKEPLARIPAGFEIGDVARLFDVERGAESDGPEAGTPGPRVAVPGTRAPLVRGAIRPRRKVGVEDGAFAEPVGPRLTPPLLDEYPDGFDFLEYNTAPPSQRTEGIPPGASLSLHGLSPRAETLRLRLPDAVPVMWVDTAEEKGIALPLGCDGVWIDTDRELVVMVYRMPMPIPSLELTGVERVTIATAKHGARAPTLDEVRADLARGAFEMAVELCDFEDEAGPPPEPSLFARYEIWERREEPTISLAMYATVAAALAEGTAPRGEVLSAHGFDEERFLLEERGWLLRMAESAQRGDTDLAARYGQLFVDAQDRLAGPGEGKESVSEYVVLKVDVEDAEEPQKVLADRKITLAAFMRMDRRWTRRAFEDDALAEEIERLTERCRAERAPGEGQSGTPAPSAGEGQRAIGGRSGGGEG